MKLFTHDHPVSMLAAPIIWALHFLLCYVLVSLVCAAGWTARVAGMDLAQWGILTLTAVALVLLGMAGAGNLGKYRRARNAKYGADGMSAFFALNAMLLTLLSALALIWVAFPAAVLPACAH